MIACGLPGKAATSLAAESGQRIEMADVEEVLAAELASHLGLRLDSRLEANAGPAGAREQ